MHRAALALLLVVAGGCHHTGGTTNDMAVADLAVPVADLAHLGHDLALCIPSGMTHAKLVVNHLTLPGQHSDFAIDLNGDGVVDDQLGDIMGALMLQGITLQSKLDQAVAAGNDVILLDAATADATFANDACATTNFLPGVNQPSPDFSGSGHFTVDGTQPATMFRGPITSTLFSSQPPPSVQNPPVTLQVRVAPFGATPLPLVGAHLSWGYFSGELQSGQIAGALTLKDVQHVLVPGLASTFNQEVQSNPTSTLSMQLRAAFDTGGAPDPVFGSCAGNTCKGVDGVCGVANDGIIQVCEVATNAPMAMALKPDVQMFDGGTYAPSLANATPDSVSVGLGFSAVAASF